MHILKTFLDKFLQKNNPEFNKQRVIAGYSIGVIGTLLTVGLFREALSWYSPIYLSAGFLICAAYSVYLLAYEQSRARMFLGKYFQALIAVILVTQIPDAFLREVSTNTTFPLQRIADLFPIIAALGAILYTFVAGEDADVIVVEKKTAK